MILLELFWAFLTIGMVSFGGGYAMLPLFERMVVQDQGWIEMARFVDMIAISQITPGPIAINSATFIGYQTAGVFGAFVSTIGVVFIPVSLVMVVARYYDQFKRSRVIKGIFVGLRPALVGLILASVFSVARNAVIDWMGIVIIAVLLLLLVKVRLHPIIVIAVSGVFGVIVYL